MNIMDCLSLLLCTGWIHIDPNFYIPKTEERELSPNSPLLMESGQNCFGMSSELQRENQELREQNAALKREVKELKATLEKFKESSRFQVRYSILS